MKKESFLFKKIPLLLLFGCLLCFESFGSSVSGERGDLVADGLTKYSQDSPSQLNCSAASLTDDQRHACDIIERRAEKFQILLTNSSGFGILASDSGSADEAEDSCVVHQDDIDR